MSKAINMLLSLKPAFKILEHVFRFRSHFIYKIYLNEIRTALNLLEIIFKLINIKNINKNTCKLNIKKYNLVI